MIAIITIITTIIIDVITSMMIHRHIDVIIDNIITRWMIVNAIRIGVAIIRIA